MVTLSLALPCDFPPYLKATFKLTCSHNLYNKTCIFFKKLSLLQLYVV